MIPIVIAGMAIARLVTPVIAKKLIREGLAKAAPPAAKVSSAKPITNMNELPKVLTKPLRPKPDVKTPKGESRGASKTALMKRTRKNRKQIAEAASKRKAEFQKTTPQRSKIVTEKIPSEYVLRRIGSESGKKLSGAKQIQGATPKTPSSQQGMRLPRKGETVKRQGGGLIKKSTDHKRAALRGHRSELKGG